MEQQKNLEKRTTGKFLVYDIVTVGVMAAIIFAITYFIRIPIPTPVGETQLKLANAFCLLAGILFGGVKGGLAAGIGSMFFDLLNPMYVTSAPYTLVFFFAMAFVCGIIANSGASKGDNKVRNIIGTVSGALAYYVLYISKSIIVLMIQGEPFGIAVTSMIPKFITSGINVVIAVVIANLLAPVLKIGLKKAGYYKIKK